MQLNMTCGVCTTGACDVQPTVHMPCKHCRCCRRASALLPALPAPGASGRQLRRRPAPQTPPGRFAAQTVEASGGDVRGWAYRFCAEGQPGRVDQQGCTSDAGASRSRPAGYQFSAVQTTNISPLACMRSARCAPMDLEARRPEAETAACASSCCLAVMGPAATASASSSAAPPCCTRAFVAEGRSGCTGWLGGASRPS